MNPKVSVIYKETIHQLTSIYEEEEASSITRILFEDLLGISPSHRLTHPDTIFSNAQHKTWQKAMDRLSNHEPIQQVVGFCYFYGLKFFVNHHVLTPRPETEELVDLILRNHQEGALNILDIGTGTGCIAISLSKNLQNAKITGWDISDDSMELAQKNVLLNDSNVTIEKVDVLTSPAKSNWGIIVSNPPYIPVTERESMDKNVLNYEPEHALFVPDDDPLLFYRKIALYGMECLPESGSLYFEIHENFGQEVKSLLMDCRYRQVHVLQDMQGKDRIVQAVK